jgi:hypothetical protein
MSHPEVNRRQLAALLSAPVVGGAAASVEGDVRADGRDQADRINGLLARGVNVQLPEGDIVISKPIYLHTCNVGIFGSPYHLPFRWGAPAGLRRGRTKLIYDGPSVPGGYIVEMSGANAGGNSGYGAGGRFALENVALSHLSIEPARAGVAINGVLIRAEGLAADRSIGWTRNIYLDKVEVRGMRGVPWTLAGGVFDVHATDIVGLSGDNSSCFKCIADGNMGEIWLNQPYMCNDANGGGGPGWGFEGLYGVRIFGGKSQALNGLDIQSFTSIFGLEAEFAGTRRPEHRNIGLSVRGACNVSLSLVSNFHTLVKVGANPGDNITRYKIQVDYGNKYNTGLDVQGGLSSQGRVEFVSLSLRDGSGRDIRGNPGLDAVDIDIGGRRWRADGQPGPGAR